MNTITKIHACWSLYEQGVSPEDIPRPACRHRATVYRWLKKIKRDGIKQFIRDYRDAKKGRRRRKTDATLKDKVSRIRDEKRRCCGQKIKLYLHRDYGDDLSVSTIYRILNERYRLRKRKNGKRGKTLRQGEMPRQVLRVDTVGLGSLYAFTAIDTFTRGASVALKEKLTAKAGEEALSEQLRFLGPAERIQRDGGPEFRKEWEMSARKHVSVIRTAKPYKKNEQAFIERFNGVLRKECVGYTKYKKSDLPWLRERVNEHLTCYRYDRPHMGLNMLTPHQFYLSHLT